MFLFQASKLNFEIVKKLIKSTYSHFEGVIRDVLEVDDDIVVRAENGRLQGFGCDLKITLEQVQNKAIQLKH